MTYEKATLKDIALMQELVLPEVENGTILHRSSDEISTNIRSYTIAKDNGTLFGFCALHFHSMELAEVRSLVVSDKVRGEGVGTVLVKTLLKEAEFYEIKKVFTLTYRKSFFENLGFSVISKEDLPSQKIWADCIKCKHFPICDEIALIKSL